MIDVTNDAALFNGEVTIVTLASGIADMMATQDNLYTVLLRGVQNGAQVESAA